MFSMKVRFVIWLDGWLRLTKPIFGIDGDI